MTRTRMAPPLLLIAALVALASTGVATAHPPDQRSLTDGVLNSPVEYDLTKRLADGAQDGPLSGHLPGSSKNVEVVGKLRFADAEPGRISDVAALGRFAYLGAYSDPACERGGVYVVDIADVANPREAGFIASPPGTFVSEGVQVLSLNTPAFKGDLLVNNNEICAAGGIGGITLTDVSDPRNPRNLARGVGDRTDNPRTILNPIAHTVHSAFAWQEGGRAFVVMVDNEEIDDVDIMEITDPANPVLIKETGLLDFTEAQAPLANGDTTFFHDVVVRKFGDRQIMLLSYWDAGYIKLDVTDPVNPRFLGDSDFPDPDPLTGFSQPEGNGHQATWDRTGRFILATDEDFSPFRTKFEITSGPNAGPYPSGEFGFTKSISTLDGRRLNGPTVYGGYGCNRNAGDIPPPSSVGALDPGEEAIVVFQRGPVQDPNNPGAACRFDEKIANAEAAGYDGVIIANHHTGADAGEAPDAAFCGGGDPRGIPGMCLGHRAFHLLFGRQPSYTVPYPQGDPGDREPNAGNRGADVAATAQFDGWGYAHLIDDDTLRHRDAYAIRESLDERYASGFGDLSVHEVKTDPSADLAYYSYYSGGFRIASFGPSGMGEQGHYIDDRGNNFWGVFPHTDQNGQRVVLMSDRDSGLWVFRYTGPGNDNDIDGIPTPQDACPDRPEPNALSGCPQVSQTGPPPAAPRTPRLKLRLLSRVRNGVVRVRVGCPRQATASCRGTLRLTYRGRRIGSRAYSVRPGRTATVGVRLTRTGRRLVEDKRITVRVTAVPRATRAGSSRATAGGSSAGGAVGG